MLSANRSAVGICSYVLPGLTDKKTKIFLIEAEKVSTTFVGVINVCQRCTAQFLSWLLRSIPRKTPSPKYGNSN